MIIHSIKIIISANGWTLRNWDTWRMWWNSRRRCKNQASDCVSSANLGIQLKSKVLHVIRTDLSLLSVWAMGDTVSSLRLPPWFTWTITVAPHGQCWADKTSVRSSQCHTPQGSLVIVRNHRLVMYMEQGERNAPLCKNFQFLLISEKGKHRQRQCKRTSRQHAQRNKSHV